MPAQNIAASTNYYFIVLFFVACFSILKVQITNKIYCGKAYKKNQGKTM